MPKNNIEKTPQSGTIDFNNIAKTTTANNSPSDIKVFNSNDTNASVALDEESKISLFKTNSDATQDIALNNPADADADLSNNVIAVSYPELIEKYSSEDLKEFKDLNPKQLSFVKQLSQTKLCAENIAAVAEKSTMPQVKKITSKVLDMEKACGDNNLDSIYITRDSYDSKAFVISAIQKDNVIMSELLDENLNLQAIEKRAKYETEDNSYMETESHDFRTNTISKVKSKYNEPTEAYYPINEIRSVVDNKGEMVSREYSRPSQIDGTFDVDVLHKNGELEQVSRGKVDEKSGVVTVKKNMTSLDGTKTLYSYVDTPSGDRALTYTITTKDGEVLMDNHKSFHVISPNHFTSTFNDKAYDITTDEKSLTVKDMSDSGKTATLAFDNITGNKETMIRALKQMPGDELLALSETTKTIDGELDFLKSYYDGRDKSMHSGSNLFVVLHELGHAKDMKKLDFTDEKTLASTIKTTISNNPEFLKIYNSEKTAFLAAFPYAQRQNINYFADSYSPENKTRSSGEIIAESNAISNTPKSVDITSIRTQYLQQYFPRTIAYLGSKL